MKVTKERIADNLLLLFFFFLPWQTRYIFFGSQIGTGVSEYAVFGVYAAQILLLLVFFLRGHIRLITGIGRVTQATYFILAGAFLSLAFTSFFNVGTAYVFNLVIVIGLFWTLCDERTNYKNVCIAFIAGLIVPSILAWTQVLSGESFSSTLLGLSKHSASEQGTAVVETLKGRMLRGYGSFGHPNIFGGYITVALFMLAWLSRKVKKSFMPYMLLCVALLAGTLVITFSRSAWLSVLTGMTIIILTMLWRKNIPPKRAIPVLILGLISMSATLVFFHQSVFARFNNDARVETIPIEERAKQYGDFNELFLSRSLIGQGPGAYTFALERMLPDKSAWYYQPIHNTFALILAELGLIGAITVFYFLIRIDQVNSAKPKSGDKILAFALSISLLIIALFDHYLWSLWSGLALTALSLAFVVRFSRTV